MKKDVGMIRIKFYGGGKFTLMVCALSGVGNYLFKEL